MAPIRKTDLFEKPLRARGRITPAGNFHRDQNIFERG
jgi:hypothetical protein